MRYPSEFQTSSPTSCATLASSEARPSLYMIAGVSGRPSASASSIVPEVEQMASPSILPPSSPPVTSPAALPTASHHASGSCSWRTSSVRTLESGALAARATDPSSSTRTTRTLCVPRSIPRVKGALYSLELMYPPRRSRPSPSCRRQRFRTVLVVDGAQVTVAETGCLHLDEHLPRTGVWALELLDLHPLPAR